LDEVVQFLVCQEFYREKQDLFAVDLRQLEEALDDDATEIGPERHEQAAAIAAQA
jgi:hypothetical protein